MSLQAYQKLLRWHWDIGARLAADELLSGVPVVTEYPKDYFDAGQQIVQRMELLLAAVTGAVAAPTGKSGLAIIVWETALLGASTKSNSLTFPGRLRIVAVESRRFNAAPTGFAPLNAQMVAAIVADNLQNFSDQGVMEIARPQDISAEHGKWLPADLRTKGDELDLVSWGLEVHSLITLPRRVKVAAPTISIVGNTITLAGAGGATVTYTTDGSYPGGDGIEYGGSFEIEPPTIVRAVASQAGSVDSDAVSLEILS